MFHQMKKRVVQFLAVVTTFLLMAVPAFATNPSTGDNSGTIMKFMLVLLIISGILIAAAVLSSIKKKKR